MKKRCFILVFTIAFLLSAAGIPVTAKEPSVSAKAAVLMDADTGKILFEKNSSEILSMASTTKVMTALLTLEYIDDLGDELVTITDAMARVEGSAMGLKAGDKILLSDLVVGMLLPSGNDAANAAALHISKTAEHFADAMNLKAEQLGMHNTHFVTPSGLDDEAHFTTAHDMALLTQAAIENPKFLSIFSAKTMAVTYNGGKKKATLKNHNKLLSLDERCIGGKTGFTKKSGRCLVSAGEKNGCRLIAVTLNAPDDWNDHMMMLDYGYSLLKTKMFPEEQYLVPTTGGMNLRIKLAAVEKSYVSGPEPIRQVVLPKFLYAAAYQKGEQIGEIRYLRDGVITERLPIEYGS